MLAGLLWRHRVTLQFMSLQSRKTLWKDAEILITNKTVLSAETINALPKLQYIGTLSTGFNVIDCQAAKQRGIPVCNVPTYCTTAVAQFTFAMLLPITSNLL